jgi:membrane associated rhomboid family serine protease
MLSRLPPATRYLLIANIVVSLLGIFSPWAWVLKPLSLWPWLPAGAPAAMPSFMPWQLLTHAFLHADPVHLMLNMLGLAMFGAMLEHEWGTRRFLVFYSVCVLGAALCQFGLATWMAFERGQVRYAVGASGGIYGLLVAFGLLFPNQRMGLFLLPLTFKARHFVIGLIALQVVLAVFGGSTGESHVAHLGGAFFGWALIRYWRRGRNGPSQRPPQGPKPPRRPSHLRAVP